MSKSLRPRGLEHTPHHPGRLCPRGSSGKTTGVDCHSLLQGTLSNPGIEHWSPALQADSLPSEPPGKPHSMWWSSQKSSYKQSSQRRGSGHARGIERDCLERGFKGMSGELRRRLLPWVSRAEGLMSAGWELGEDTAFIHVSMHRAVRIRYLQSVPLACTPSKDH